MTARPGGAGVRAAVARAQLEWAQMALDGRNGPADAAAALAWFRTAALQGDAHAINMLGRACERGWGMAADLKAAADHYRRAAELGDAWAMFNLADLLLAGRGLAQDEIRACALYAASAALGNAKALNMLGLLHEDGRGCERDPAYALLCFRLSAQGSDCWGGFNLGRRLADEGEIAEAARAIDLAIECGFPDFWREAAAMLQSHPHEHIRSLAAKSRSMLESRHHNASAQAR